MKRVLFAVALAVCAAGCSKKETEADRDPYVYGPVKIASAYIAMVEKPDAARVLLLGEEARSLGPCFQRAGMKPVTALDGTFDIILVSCDEMTEESCARTTAHLSENGVMVWMTDVRGVTAGRFRSRVRSFALANVHLWMPGEGRWLLVGRKSEKRIKLSAMLEVFAREGTFGDLAAVKCGTLPELFANYAGKRDEFMPAFALLASDAEVRPANFLTSKVGAVDWIATEGTDEDIARTVMSEIRSMQVIRRQVVEGGLVAAAAVDKKGEEKATDIWSRSYLRNPNDLFLLERIDRLERNAKVFLGAGKVLQAMKCYETILLICPNDAAAVHNFGMCLKKIGKVDLAQKVLQRAERLVGSQSASGSKP